MTIVSPIIALRPTATGHYGDRAFMTAGPALWNKLPLFIRAENDFNKYKTLVKSYFFRKAFACYE